MLSFQIRAVLWGGLALCGCRGGEAAPEASPQFRVATPEIKTTEIRREYVAEIRAARYAELRSRFKGVLETVSVDEGGRVRANQPLFTVNSRALKQEVLVARAATLGAEAELKAAQLEYQSTKLLQEKNVVSSAELAMADSKVQTLRAKVEEAKATAARAVVELGYAEVRAPFDGVVNRIPRKAGSAVAEDELLTSITDTTEVFAYFRISEREHLELSGTASTHGSHGVSLKLVDGSMFPSEGIVDAIESEFDRETGTLTHRARFANSTGTLKHGSSGKIVLRSELKDAVIVPQRSTFDVQGDVYVYVVDSNNVPHARKISVKARLADGFVVDKGLEGAERFVLEGVQKIKDGNRIDVVVPTAQLTSGTGG